MHAVTIDEVLAKYRANEDLEAHEQTILQNWIKASPENLLKLEAMPVDAVKQADSVLNVNNGSASAFEGTENPVQFEKDISDDNVDELVEDRGGPAC